MDEPCSALDPIATARIEDLMQELKAEYTIVIVTHNMQQAARVSDRTAFFTAEVNPDGDRRTGVLVEYDAHREDLLESGRRTHRELRHRPIRLIGRADGERDGRQPKPSTRSSTRSATTSCGWRRWSPSSSRAAPRSLLVQRPARRPGADRRPTTASTRSRSRSRTTATRCSRCSSRWPATCARSSPRSGSCPRSSAPATSWSTSPRAPAACTARRSSPRLRGLIEQMSEEAARLFKLADRRLRRRQRRPRRRARRHRRSPRRPARRLHRIDLRVAPTTAGSTSRPACSWR